MWQKFLAITEKTGVGPEDDEDARLQKSILVKTSILISVAAIIWGLIYIAFGEIWAGLIPLIYALLSAVSLLVLKISNVFGVYRFSQILLILLLPFLLMMTLGGFINGSVVILWALLAPIGALLSGRLRQASYWFIAFLCLVILSGLIHPYLKVNNNLPSEVITFFFVINIVAVSFITFLVLNYFVKNKDKVIELIHKNRELEVAQLQKEVMLRKSDKLATLGRLSAGIAHELNNPSTAALRGSKLLQENLLKLEKYAVKLGQINLSEEQFEIYNQFKEQINTRSKNPMQLKPLTISDREYEIESWLENQKITDDWDMASNLAKLGFTTDELKNLADHFSNEHLKTIISSLHTNYLSNNLLEEISQGTGRITEIVKSLKSYSYQEEAPLQSIDIHEGLNDTLVMFRSQLKKGITVERDYNQNLPHVEAYSNELNQVWTNIIDNAIVAMNGQGKILIKTYQDNSWIVVQISDTGHGIPGDIQTKIFDPFFTTKSPGEGTGLGLNISHNIVVNRHKGKIQVSSKPGETCFEVRLPIQNGSPKMP